MGRTRRQATTEEARLADRRARATQGEAHVDHMGGTAMYSRGLHVHRGRDRGRNPLVRRAVVRPEGPPLMRDGARIRIRI